jgi:hypothetical protein
MKKIMILCCLFVSHNVTSSDLAADVEALTTEMQRLSVEKQGVTSVTDSGVQDLDKLAKKVVGFTGDPVSHVDYCRYLFRQIQGGHGKSSARRSSRAFARHFGRKSQKWGKKEAVLGLTRRVERHPRCFRTSQKIRRTLTFEQLVARATREEALEEQLR